MNAHMRFLKVQFDAERFVGLREAVGVVLAGAEKKQAVGAAVSVGIVAGRRQSR
jgi:hypothetical protein